MMFPPFNWGGGKFLQLKNVLPFLNPPHKTYVEPFGGSGCVLLNRLKSEFEVYNELNPVLTFFFQVLKTLNIDTFRELERYYPHSRRFWRETKNIVLGLYDGLDVTDLLETQFVSHWDTNEVLAFCFFYCQNYSYRGRFVNSFHTQTTSIRNVNEFPNKIERLGEIQRRFKDVVIENLDCLDCIDKYDSEDTLFYCDPPYECKSSKKFYMTEFNTASLVDKLCHIKGTAVLSCYDSESYYPLLEVGFKKQHFASKQQINHLVNKDRVETVYYRVNPYS